MVFPTTFPSGEEFNTHVWECDSWSETMEILNVLRPSLLPMELWRTKGSGSFRPRRFNPLVWEKAPDAQLYDSYDISLGIDRSTSCVGINMWNYIGQAASQHLIEVPRMAEWITPAGEPFPRFIGEDFSFHSGLGPRYFWQSCSEFFAWAKFKHLIP